MTEGAFREDLYHRLNVIQIVSPPLRDRREDLPALLDHYLREAAKELDTETKTISPQALTLLEQFDWPGNVRQLVNLCRRLTALAPGREIRPQDIPEAVGEAARSRGADAGSDWTASLANWARESLERGEPLPLLHTAVPEFERVMIRAALAKTAGRRQKAAELLGWGRNTLTRKIQELGL